MILWVALTILLLCFVINELRTPVKIYVNIVHMKDRNDFSLFSKFGRPNKFSSLVEVEKFVEF